MLSFYRNRENGNILAINDAIRPSVPDGLACIMGPPPGQIASPGATIDNPFRTGTIRRRDLHLHWYEISAEIALLHNGAIYAGAMISTWGGPNEPPPKMRVNREHLAAQGNVWAEINAIIEGKQ